MCTMTSVSTPWSGQPVRAGTRSRWPDDEIGRNSVMPWIRARTTIWRISMKLTSCSADCPACELEFACRRDAASYMRQHAGQCGSPCHSVDSAGLALSQTMPKLSSISRSIPSAAACGWRLPNMAWPLNFIDETPWEPSAAISSSSTRPARVPVYLEDCGIADVRASRRSPNISKKPRPPARRSFPAMPSRAPRCAASSAGSTSSSMPRSRSPCSPKRSSAVSCRARTAAAVTGHGPGAPGRAAAAANISTISGHLADHRTWLAGDDLSLADLAAAAHISAIDYLGDVPWADYPVAQVLVPAHQVAAVLPAAAGRHGARHGASAHYADLDF